VIYIEEIIVNAVTGLLSERVNELLAEGEESVPLVEFGCDGLGFAGGICPEITLALGEREEKDRIVRVDVYSVSIAIRADVERVCYAYAGAVGRALAEDPTLGGVVEWAGLVRKKYGPPKTAGCGGGWEAVFTLRVTVE
jgi:hypothetical protein